MSSPHFVSQKSRYRKVCLNNCNEEVFSWSDMGSNFNRCFKVKKDNSWTQEITTNSPAFNTVLGSYWSMKITLKRVPNHCILLPSLVQKKKRFKQYRKIEGCRPLGSRLSKKAPEGLLSPRGQCFPQIILVDSRYRVLGYDCPKNSINVLVRPVETKGGYPRPASTVSRT